MLHIRIDRIRAWRSGVACSHRQRAIIYSICIAVFNDGFENPKLMSVEARTLLKRASTLA